jgi:hypothetical protein
MRTLGRLSGSALGYTGGVAIIVGIAWVRWPVAPTPRTLDRVRALDFSVDGSRPDFMVPITRYLASGEAGNEASGLDALLDAASLPLDDLRLNNPLYAPTSVAQSEIQRELLGHRTTIVILGLVRLQGQLAQADGDSAVALTPVQLARVSTLMDRLQEANRQPANVGEPAMIQQVLKLAERVAARATTLRQQRLSNEAAASNP